MQARVLGQRAVVVVDAHALRAVQQCVGHERVVADAEQEVAGEFRRGLDGLAKLEVRNARLDGPGTCYGVTGHYRPDPVASRQEDFAAASEHAASTDQNGMRSSHPLVLPGSSQLIETGSSIRPTS